MDVASAFCDHFCCPWFRDLPNFNVEVSSEWWILEVYWIMTLSIFTFSLFCLPYTDTHTLSPAFHGLSMLLMCYLFLSVKSWNILFLGWMDSRLKYYLHRFYLLIEMVREKTYFIKCNFYLHIFLECSWFYWQFQFDIYPFTFIVCLRTEIPSK